MNGTSPLYDQVNDSLCPHMLLQSIVAWHQHLSAARIKSSMWARCCAVHHELLVQGEGHHACGCQGFQSASKDINLT